MKQEHNLEPGPAFSSTDIKYPKPLREFASFVNMWIVSLGNTQTLQF
jgi:hypothetical protein